MKSPSIISIGYITGNGQNRTFYECIKDEIEVRIAKLSKEKFRRPVMMLAIDGAHAPTRPDPRLGKAKEEKVLRKRQKDSDCI